MNNFFPNGVASWIVIITHFKIMPSIGKLKEHLISLFCPNIKSTFDIHNTIAIGPRCIFQLRLRLSPLRSHKWCHNSFDTVTDTCNCNQGIEDPDHFLFSCPSFETQRALLIITLNGIALRNNLDDFRNQSHLYFYGHRSINHSNNKTILLSTIKDIKDTRRFTS